MLLLSLHCAQLLLQLLGVASLRETLPLCHLLLVLSGVVIIAALIHLQTQGLFGRRELLLGFSIGCCVLGLAIDLYRYYTVERPETLSFSLYAFLLLVLFSGFVSYHELSQRAQLDMQTDLYNKATCEEMLSGMPPADVPTGVIMFDLNGLKRVNDTWGHEAGDELIVSFARLLRANMPAGAFIGRYGGDEFVAILHHTSKAQLAAAAGRPSAMPAGMCSPPTIRGRAWPPCSPSPTPSCMSRSAGSTPGKASAERACPPRKTTEKEGLPPPDREKAAPLFLS